MRLLQGCWFLLTAMFSAQGLAAEGRDTLATLVTALDAGRQEMALRAMPEPFRHLLASPLLTPALEQCFRATAVIDPLYVRKDIQSGDYFRVIIMRMPGDHGASLPAELALVSIHAAALPPGMVADILEAKAPFGSLLGKYRIKTRSSGIAGFTIPCTYILRTHLGCDVGERLYGRTNIIVREEDGEWLARTVEVLPPLECKLARE